MQCRQILWSKGTRIVDKEFKIPIFVSTSDDFKVLTV